MSTAGRLSRRSLLPANQVSSRGGGGEGSVAPVFRRCKRRSMRDDRLYADSRNHQLSEIKREREIQTDTDRQAHMVEWIDR